MKIDVLTLFPEMFSSLNHSLIGKAIDKKLIDLNLVNIRDFTLDKNKRCDDYSYGGGAGMIMTPQPLFDAIQSVKTPNSYVIFLSPKGNLLTQEKVQTLSQMGKDLVLVCGHYEGIDERIVDLCVDEELSIGDYVLTGGELPAMVVIDSVARYVDGVLGNSETTSEESFCDNLLEYPQYTRPSEFMGKKVPQILLDGDHGKVAKWREEMSISLTKSRRPDLYRKYLNQHKKTDFDTKK